MNDIVLSVIAGASSRTKRVFSVGAAVPPFSVGSLADWAITAADVQGAHFYLAFDGQRLHVAAVSPGSNIFVPGLEVGTAFVPLPVPCNLFFGAGCIAITSESNGSRTTPLAAAIRTSHRLPDLSRTDQMQTQLFDLSRAMQHRTQRLEVPESTLASLRAGSVAGPTPSGVQSHEIAAPRTFALSGTLDMASTLYDGGALRERAAQLASVMAPAATAAVEPAQARRNWLAKPLAAFRRGSLPRQITLLMLLLLAAVASWWMPRARTVAAAASAPVRAAAAPSVPIAKQAGVTSKPPLLASVSSAPTEDLARAPSRSSDALERAALGAAFSGNKVEAAALYDRLAAGHDARLFSLAARLAREDRVRKP